MGKLLVLLMLLGSGFAAANAEDKKQLSVEEITNPKLVEDWLRINKTIPSFSKKLFDQGIKSKAIKNWGAAYKAFGESALAYPTPFSITEFTEAKLHLLNQSGKIREKLDVRNDLSYAELGYRSALAADGVLNQLFKEDKINIQKKADCLKEYLEKEIFLNDCEPLKIYGIVK